MVDAEGGRCVSWSCRNPAPAPASFFNLTGAIELIKLNRWEKSLAKEIAEYAWNASENPVKREGLKSRLGRAKAIAKLSVEKACEEGRFGNVGPVGSPMLALLVSVVMKLVLWYLMQKYKKELANSGTKDEGQ